MNVRWIPVAGILPLPTRSREVSGRKRNMEIQHIPDRITRNQKIQRQPMVWERMPPMTGPRLGARFGLVKGH